MKRMILLLLFFVLVFDHSVAQDLTKTFELALPTFKVYHSLYNKIQYLDSRADTEDIGIVGIGSLKNHEAKFVLPSSFQQAMQRLLNALIDSTAMEGQILFQLRRFNFVETSGSRYCFLIATLYANENGQYKKLSTLDTVMIERVKDVPKYLTLDANTIISQFLAKGLVQHPKDSQYYSMVEVQNIDSIEEASMPLYNRPNLIDGIYYSYATFKKQVPDKIGVVGTRRDGSISSIRILGDQGEKIKIKPKYIYAVVDKGKPFVATEFGYYPLEKLNDNNFMFTGDIRIVANSNDIYAGYVVLGITGALLAESGNRITYALMIDHLSGRFIHLY